MNGLNEHNWWELEKNILSSGRHASMATAMLWHEACNLRRNNYTVVGLTIRAGPHGKKLGFHSGWAKATPDTCLEHFHVEGDNALALVTGDASDLFVVDADLAKPDDVEGGRIDGFQLMETLIAEHGLPPNTPVQRTGTGGRHFLFSLSRSLQAGLHRAKNDTKISYKGQQTTIDVRGDGGCIIVSPTQYQAGGQLRKYEWLSPLGSIEELPAMPPWLIDVVNKDPDKAERPSKRRKTGAIVPAGAAGRPEPQDSAEERFFQSVKDRVAEHQGVIGRHWTRDNGFDFAPEDRSTPCHNCGANHTSNNYLARRVISTCFYIRNYSNRCCTKIFNTKEVKALEDLYHAPTSDDRFVDLLRLVIRDDGHALAYTGKAWMCFQGLVWDTLSDLEIKRRIKVDLNYGILETLLRCLSQKDDKGVNINAEEGDRISVPLRKAHLHLMKAGNVNSVAESAKQLLLDETIAPQMDTNKDILACANGVVELQSGQLRAAVPGDYLSRFITTEYHPDGENPDVDAFFASIFNNDRDVVDYIQRLLGYGITGHTSEQVWAIFTGLGSNGKSLLLDNLRDLLQDFYLTPAKEVFFQAGRGSNAGGHTAHLCPLKGRRVVAREETNDIDRFDTELLKNMSGEGQITTRAPYSADYITFRPTHLTILACNKLPPIDIEDNAMLRRMIVVPFTNIYAGPDDRIPYNAANPRHRLKDPKLREKLQQPHVQRQFLRWLVEGAVAWYKNGLGAQPEALKAAMGSYILDNDTVTQFLNERCVVGETLIVNAAQLKNVYIDAVGHKIKQKEFQRAMERRGFPFKVNKIGGTSAAVYRGLQLMEL